MNLREIKEHLSSVDSKIIFSLEKYGLTRDSKGYYRFDQYQLDELKFALDYLIKIPSLKESILQLKNTSIYENNGLLQTHISTDEWENIKSILKNLHIEIIATKNIVDSLIPEADSTTLMVKLPDHAKDFDSLGKVMNDLKKAISIPISDSDTEGTVVVNTAEPGSIWLVVALGTSKALKLIGELCWGAAVIKKKNLESDFIKEQIKDYELTNEQKKIFIDAQKKLVDSLVEKEVKRIQDDYYEEKGNESAQRLIMSIHAINDLMKQGAEFRPSLSASEEVKNLFPSHNSFGLLESRIKLIKDTENKPNNENQ